MQRASPLEELHRRLDGQVRSVASGLAYAKAQSRIFQQTVEIPLQSTGMLQD